MAVATPTLLHCTGCGRTWRPVGPLPAPRACPVCHSDSGRPGRSPFRRALEGRPRYPSLRAFYEANSNRVPAPERDFGLWWLDDSDGPVHRAAWVEATGELYIVCCDAADGGGSDVEVLAVTNRPGLERALSGWREVCGQEHSLDWLRRRAGALAGG